MSMPAWVTDPGSLTLTEDQYDGLPDHVRKMVEVIDGHVIFCQSGTPEHSDVARRLANRLEAAKPTESVHPRIDRYRRAFRQVEAYRRQVLLPAAGRLGPAAGRLGVPVD